MRELIRHHHRPRKALIMDLLAELATAKRNVLWLLDHADGLVDMHGLTYWAGCVERLRAEIRKA